MPDKFLEILKNISERIKSELLLFYVALSIIVSFIPSMEVRYIVLAFGLVGSLIYVYHSRSKGGVGKKLDVYVVSAHKGHHFLLEIFNSGSEDIIDFKIQLSWQQRGQEHRDIEFIGENENPTVARPRKLNVLKNGERVYGWGIPNFSTEGKIRVVVSGRGSSSGKTLNQVFEVPNQIKTDW